MTVIKIIVEIEETGELMLGDAIFHEMQWWLVLGWLPGSRPKTERPTRIIALADWELGGPSNGADRTLNTPMSKAVLEGHETTSRRVVDHPKIEVPIETQH